MNIEERERELLRFVEEERDKVCRELLADAKARTRALIRDAYRRHRAALHDRVVAERTRAEGLLRAASAERATALRRRGELADGELIRAAWPRLEAHLAERWRAAETRVRWVDAALGQALERLPRFGWTIRHAGGWSETERAAAQTRLVEAGIDAPALRSDSGMVAGLVVIAGGAVLDMSLAGLLRDRARVQARLLALAKQADADLAVARSSTVPGAGMAGET
jgi:hypothetical protein